MTAAPIMAFTVECRRIELSFPNNKKQVIDKTINLYSSYTEKKTYLEVLAYELIKRRLPLEYITEEVLYQKLKETTIESYFSEFIQKHLISILDYYEQYHTLNIKNNFNKA